ncbi:metallophosphoesterase family protein [Caldicoprobacter guelmensis]|uniref:metallophosphoesterase family protein n=1 Tax=Caldicoprobacter guelmensis TaxID=1170224 RepID=UPI001959581D|nr:DNA repair exonuclease [Caldicoprobacter guelmensis]
MVGVKLLHLADVHLDTPFQVRTKDMRMFLRQAIRQAFQKAVDLAISKNVHAVLIAGDLFDNQTLSFSTEKFMVEQMKRLYEAQIPVFYAPGNHDPAGVMYRRSLIEWSDNVKVFNTKQPETCPVYDREGRLVAWVTGAGHEGPREKDNIIKDFPRAGDADIPHIGLAHVWVTGARGEGEHDRYAPCTLEDIIDKCYTYWALGHIHTRVHLAEKPLVIYPGNLVGRHHGEEGLKGAYLVEIDEPGRVKAEFYPVAPVRWATFKVNNLSQARTLAELQEHIYKAVVNQLENEKQSGGMHDVIARVLLEGPCLLYSQLRLQEIGCTHEENIQVLEEYLYNALGFRYVEVVPDGLTRPVVPASYRGQPHVLGVALDILQEAKTDPQVLLKLKPDILAGCPAMDTGDVIAYLHELLEGLDYEVTARLMEEMV